MKTALVTLWIGWAASLVAAQSCVIEVSQDMMRRLTDVKQSREPCEKVWAHLLLHMHYTRRNLTTCQEREQANVEPEPSFTECQQQLENLKLDMQDDQRYYGNVMQKKIQLNEWNVQKYRNEKASLQAQFTKVHQEFKGYYRELLFVNVAAGAPKKALKYYHLYLEGQPPGQLLNDLVASVYADPAHENEKLENLLDFVRKLAGKSVKLALYELIRVEVMKRPTQRDSYLAMVAALDLGRIVFLEANNYHAVNRYHDLFLPALEHLKRVVLAGQYDEVIHFAATYPDHFEQIENRLSTLDTDVWHRTDFNRFVTYPNRLPLATQRLEAIRMLLLQIIRRNKRDFTDRLVKVAKELHQCEKFMRQGKIPENEQDKLISMKRLFGELDPTRDYEHYLQKAQQEQQQQ